MTRFEIVDGPGKWDLVVGLFDGATDQRKKVLFHLEDPDSTHPVEPMLIPFSINVMSREDGSGDNWLFHGYYGHRTANGFFSIKTRKGWVEMERY